jgi:hypothetical protein
MMQKLFNRIVIIAFVAILGALILACDNGSTSDDRLISVDGFTPEPVFVPANTANGFNFGYFYYIPPRVRNVTYLLVEPNNAPGLPGDDQNQIAQNIVRRLRPMAHELGVVVLVPVFPRSTTPQTTVVQALSRQTLQINSGPLARVDLQLIQMVDDLRQICQSKDVRLQPKVLLNGFSSSGQFVNRFTAIHPGFVQAVASGGMRSSAILPLEVIDGQRLIFTVGIADLATLTGNAFDLAKYRSVPQFIYWGAEDNYNDPLPFASMFSDEERRLILQILGQDIPGRFENAQRIHREQGANAIFRSYPGVGHDNTPMQRDIIAFFMGNM